jgi:hypothetical protein
MDGFSEHEPGIPPVSRPSTASGRSTPRYSPLAARGLSHVKGRIPSLTRPQGMHLAPEVFQRFYGARG